MNLDTLFDPLAAALLVVMTVVFPISGVLEYRWLVRNNAAGDPESRRRYYNWITASEWVTVALFLAWWFATGRSAAPLGLVPAPSGWQWLTVGVGFAVVVTLVLQTAGIKRNPQALSKLRDNLGDLAEMTPRTPREQRGFDRLSITAGICEEILYRGVLLAILATAIGTWSAVCASSAIFGLGHIYQGPLGFVRTAAVGLAFALLTLFSGSLLTAIVVHIALDMTSGRAMHAAVTLPAEDSPGATASIAP